MCLGHARRLRQAVCNVLRDVWCAGFWCAAGVFLAACWEQQAWPYWCSGGINMWAVGAQPGVQPAAQRLLAACSLACGGFQWWLAQCWLALACRLRSAFLWFAPFCAPYAQVLGVGACIEMCGPCSGGMLGGLAAHDVLSCNAHD